MVIYNLNFNSVEFDGFRKEKEERFEILSEIAKYQLDILNNVKKIKLFGDKNIEK